MLEKDIKKEQIHIGSIAQVKNQGLVHKKHLQIAKGATKLFIKKGYARTSIRDITKSTGLTIGNLYDYIVKKEDILYLVFDVFHTIWTRSLEKEEIWKIENPAEQLCAALEEMLKVIDQHREMVLLMYTEGKCLPKNYLKKILEKESGLIDCFARILQNGVEKGAFAVEDPFLAANIIVYLLSFEALRGWNLKYHHYPSEQVKEILVQTICRSILKPAK